MDWTRYGGHLHTDHSIRSEFFRPEPEKAKEIASQQWLQDFLYLYDPSAADYERFSSGAVVDIDEVIQAIGDPEEFTQLVGPIATDESEGIPQDPQVKDLLAKCSLWRMTPSELEALESTV